MLVVHLDALRLIHLLNFLHQIFRDALQTAPAQHVLRPQRAFGQRVARRNVLADAHVEVAAIRNRKLALHRHNRVTGFLNRVENFIGDFGCRRCRQFVGFATRNIGGEIMTDQFAAFVDVGRGLNNNATHAHLRRVDVHRQLHAGLNFRTSATDNRHHSSVNRGRDRFAFGATRFKQFHNAEQATDSGFENFQILLDFAFLLRRVALNRYGALVHVRAQLLQRLLARALHVRHTGQVVARRDAAQMEGTHRQLRARFANRLRRDDANRFADFHAVIGREVMTVARCTNAVTQFASQD